MRKRTSCWLSVSGGGLLLIDWIDAASVIANDFDGDDSVRTLTVPATTQSSINLLLENPG